MGKARIVSGGGNGLYRGVVEYDTTRLDARITKLESELTEIELEVLNKQLLMLDAKTAMKAKEAERDALADIVLSDPDKFGELQAKQKELWPLVKAYTNSRKDWENCKLKRLSTQKEIAYLNGSKPQESEQDFWCADFTEDLSPGSIVPTMEINGEGVSIIRPHYSAPVYSGQSDGAFQPVMSSGFSAVFYNWSLLPGWQKWKPTIRVGVISSIELNKCTVTLDPAKSSQQALEINQATVLTDVPIEYMHCHGGAFENGDRVVVWFEDQDWSKPKVIGFESNPQPCSIDEFVCLPISDTSPAGWGLPDDGNIGTAGGGNSQVKIRTEGYVVERFITATTGNCFWKSKNGSLPILSWDGPENGYLIDTTYLYTEDGFVGTVGVFGQSIYAYGLPFATIADNHVVGCGLRRTNDGFSVYVMKMYNSNRTLELLKADILSLTVTNPITTWTVLSLPATNSEAPWDSLHRTDTRAAFNDDCTKCAWVYTGEIFTLDVDSLVVTMTSGSINEAEDTGTPDYSVIEVNHSTSDNVPDPCGGSSDFPLTVDVDEQLTVNFLHRWIAGFVIAVDWDGSTLVKLERIYTWHDSEAAVYTSTHTHTRQAICGAQFEDNYDNYSATTDRRTIRGRHFRINGVDLTEPSLNRNSGTVSGSGLRGWINNASQTAGQRLDSAGLQNQYYSWQEVYIRKIDLKSRMIVYSEKTLEGTGQTDSENYIIGTASVRHAHTIGGKSIFHTVLSETRRIEDWDTDLAPEGELITIKHASDRYGNKDFLSVFDDFGVSLLNYLTDADPVSLLSIPGTNPRFSMIGVM